MTYWILRTIAGSLENGDCIAESPVDAMVLISSLGVSPMPEKSKFILTMLYVILIGAVVYRQNKLNKSYSFPILKECVLLAV